MRIFGLHFGRPSADAEVARLRAQNTELSERAERLTRALAETDEARRRAEVANHAKSELLASMSHALRTPLNAILGFAQLMQLNTFKEPLKARQREAVEQILDGGRHLLTQVEALVDLVRADSSAAAVPAGRVGVDEVLADVAQNFSLQAKRADVQIRPGRGPGLPLTVAADRAALRHILSNLVSNAIKYNRAGGEVRIKVSNDKGCVSIAVTDTGSGIAPALLPNLFRPFNRLGLEGGGIPGNGVGLVVARRLARSMNGDLIAESVEGVGSTFTLTLPLASADPSGARAHEPAAGAMPAATIVYVEDDPSSIALMQRAIASVDKLTLHIAEDSAAALDAIGRLKPGLVLIDLGLPGMGGIELLRRLRASPETASIPAVALTASAMADEVRLGQEAGFFAYLTKPVDLNLLYETISRACAGSRTASTAAADYRLPEVRDPPLSEGGLRA